MTPIFQAYFERNIWISYGYVANQLTDFEDLIKHIDSSKKLGEFVQQIEEVISREHIWRDDLF